MKHFQCYICLFYRHLDYFLYNIKLFFFSFNTKLFFVQYQFLFCTCLECYIMVYVFLSHNNKNIIVCQNNNNNNNDNHNKNYSYVTQKNSPRFLLFADQRFIILNFHRVRCRHVDFHRVRCRHVDFHSSYPWNKEILLHLHVFTHLHLMKQIVTLELLRESRFNQFKYLWRDHTLVKL